MDIGCGMGQHAKQYSDMGAKSVPGIDISEKMLKYANENFCAKNITYQQLALENISVLDEQFDLVTSSLVFDYAEDLDKPMRNVYQLMKDEAQFVFSMSHPMATAWDGTYDRYTRTVRWCLAPSGFYLLSMQKNIMIYEENKKCFYIMVLLSAVLHS